jgi:hypothetical protein
LLNFSFTLTDAEDYAAREKWQKIIIYILIVVLLASVIGAVVEKKTSNTEIVAWRVERSITFVRFIREALLRNYWSVNLRAIEN